MIVPIYSGPKWKVGDKLKTAYHCGNSDLIEVVDVKEIYDTVTSFHGFSSWGYKLKDYPNKLFKDDYIPESMLRDHY